MQRIVLGTIVVIFFACGLATGGFWEDLPAGPIPDLTIEKAVASEEAPQAAASDEKPAKDNSIFSWPTIIMLNLTVIGIVAVRRNTFN